MSGKRESTRIPLLLRFRHRRFLSRESSAVGSPTSHVNDEFRGSWAFQHSTVAQYMSICTQSDPHCFKSRHRKGVIFPCHLISTWWRSLVDPCPSNTTSKSSKRTSNSKTNNRRRHRNIATARLTAEAEAEAEAEAAAPAAGTRIRADRKAGREGARSTNSGRGGRVGG